MTLHRVEIRNGRSPFEFALTSVCATSGLLGLTMPPPGPSANIVRTFGDHGAPWFYLAMLVSALIVLVGPWWPPRTCIRNLMMSLRIERIGLIPQGSCALAYGLANLLITGKPALIAGLLIGGIGAASWVRALIIARDLRKLQALLHLDESTNDPAEPTTAAPVDGGDTPTSGAVT